MTFGAGREPGMPAWRSALEKPRLVGFHQDSSPLSVQAGNLRYLRITGRTSRGISGARIGVIRPDAAHVRDFSRTIGYELAVWNGAIHPIAKQAQKVTAIAGIGAAEMRATTTGRITLFSWLARPVATLVGKHIATIFVNVATLASFGTPG